MAAANISVKDPDGNIRSHGRGGGGAVMGSKKVKYITIDDTGGPGVKIADPEKFKTQARIFAKALLDHPVSGQGLPTYGTNVLINILNEAGGLPTKNFRYGRLTIPRKSVARPCMTLSLHEVVTPAMAAMPAVSSSVPRFTNDAEGKYITSGFEYETIWGFGANISDLDDIAKCDWVMDDIGIDSIEGAVMINVAMEAGIIPWGDGKAAYQSAG